MKYFKKADSALDVEVNKLSTIGNQSLIVKNTGGGNDNDLFISNSGLRKAKFRSTANNSLGVSTLAPFSVFKVDGGENLVPEPKIVDVSFVSNYDTLEIEGGVIYGSKVKANLIDIHKIIIESEQEIQLTDCIGVCGITGYGTRYDHIGYISDNLEYIDFITPNKIDITKLFLDVLLRGININPIETCFYLRTSIDDDQTIYEITQTFTGRTKLGDPITVDVNDENVDIDYDVLLTENFTSNVLVNDNIATFADLSGECTIIYDGEITDTLVLGAYMKSGNVIGLLGDINELISSGDITYNDNIITIPEGAGGWPAEMEGFYCIFNVNLSDDGTTPTSVNLVPTSYVAQEIVINKNPYYFETEGEHEVEFEYVNKFYPNLVYPRTNDYFSDSCIIELNDNFYDYYNDAKKIYKIEKITLSNNVPEYIVEDHILYLKSFSNLKEININTDKYITINNCVINKTNWSLAGYCGTDIVVPGLVKSIGTIFSNNSKLKTVVLPNGITSISNNAFTSCSSLTSVNIPNSVTSIGVAAFENCSSLTSVNIPDTVTSIKFDAFNGCSSLTTINIPDSVTSIGNQAFYGCSNLTSVTIGNSVTSIGNGVFGGCSNLTSVTIGNSVTSIGNGVFSGCSSLTTINIPDSVTSIGSSAFNYCSDLTSVTIPDSVTSIGSGAFYACSNLTSVNISNLESWVNINFNNEYSNPLYYADNLYLNGQLVTDLIIPESVTEIKPYSFIKSSLETVQIADSVTSIGTFAFQNCTSLSEITCYAMTAPTITSNTFMNVKTGGVLKVPAGATGYDAWMSTSNYYLGKYGWTIEYFDL